MSSRHSGSPGLSAIAGRGASTDPDPRAWSPLAAGLGESGARFPDGRGAPGGIR